MSYSSEQRSRDKTLGTRLMKALCLKYHHFVLKCDNTLSPPFFSFFILWRAHFCLLITKTVHDPMDMIQLTLLGASFSESLCLFSISLFCWRFKISFCRNIISSSLLSIISCNFSFSFWRSWRASSFFCNASFAASSSASFKFRAVVFSYNNAETKRN